MAVRFLPDASGFDLATARARFPVEGAGQIWAAWLRKATVIPSLLIENENGDVREVNITEPVVVKSPFKSIRLTNAAGLGTLRIAVSDSICDDISLGGVKGIAIPDPETVQASGHDLAGPAAATYTYIELFNPFGSGVNLFFDRVDIAFSGNMPLQFRRNLGQLGTAGVGTTRIAPIFTDLRDAGTPVAQLGWFRNNNVVGIGVGLSRTIPAINFIVTPPHPIIITPGYALLFRGTIVNRGIEISPWWRELPVV